MWCPELLSVDVNFQRCKGGPGLNSNSWGVQYCLGQICYWMRLHVSTGKTWEGPRSLHTFDGPWSCMHVPSRLERALWEDNLGQTWQQTELRVSSPPSTQIHWQRWEPLLFRGVWAYPLSNHKLATKLCKGATPSKPALKIKTRIYF